MQGQNYPSHERYILSLTLIEMQMSQPSEGCTTITPVGQAQGCLQVSSAGNPTILCRKNYRRTELKYLIDVCGRVDRFSFVWRLTANL